MNAFETIKKTIEERKLIRDGDTVIVGFSGGPDSLCMLHCLLRLSAAPAAPSPGGPKELDPSSDSPDGCKLMQRWKLCAVHVNHQLRGEAADGDQAFVEAFCAERGIACFSYKVDVARMAREGGLSTEDAGRRARYRAFEKVRRQLAAHGGCSEPLGIKLGLTGQDGGSERPLGVEPAEGRYLVAVAQNANDQAETVLMRIMRGTGLNGLGAMDYARADGVIRPLLDVTREQVEAYCQEQGLSPRADLTNQEPDYTRNRIRLELLPYMKKRYNENIVETLNRLAAIAREDSSYIDDIARKLTDEALASESSGVGRRIAPFHRNSAAPEEGADCPPAGDGDNFAAPARLSVAVEALRGQPPAVRRRMILQLLGRLGLERNISAVHLRQADRIIEKRETPATVVFPQGCRLTISYDRAVFEREREGTGIAGRGERKWSWTEIPGKIRLEMEILSAAELGDPARLPADRRAFDLKAVKAAGLEPVLRTRRAGDFIRPFGMKGTKKIQDYFVDKKVPRELRDELPLVCLGSEVIWVTEIDGFDGTATAGTTGEPYRVRPDTGEILLMKIRSE